MTFFVFVEGLWLGAFIADHKNCGSFLSIHVFIYRLCIHVWLVIVYMTLYGGSLCTCVTVGLGQSSYMYTYKSNYF